MELKKRVFVAGTVFFLIYALIVGIVFSNVYSRIRAVEDSGKKSIFDRGGMAVWKLTEKDSLKIMEIINIRCDVGNRSQKSGIVPVRAEYIGNDKIAIGYIFPRQEIVNFEGDLWKVNCYCEDAEDCI